MSLLHSHVENQKEEEYGKRKRRKKK